MSHSLRNSAESLPTKAEMVKIIEGGIFRRRPPEEPFELKAGTSWTYVDAKRAVGSGEDLARVGRYAVAALRKAELGFTAVGGLTMGATPVAIAIAMAGGSRWFEVCKEPETKYSASDPLQITGTRFVPGDRLLIAEDVTSTGGSALEAVDAIRHVCATQEIEDVEVIGVVTMLDRGRLAAARFADVGLSFVALTSFADVGLESVN
jgi:orotate phosphoribosyltransferase